MRVKHIVSSLESHNMIYICKGHVHTSALYNIKTYGWFLHDFFLPILFTHLIMSRILAKLYEQ